MSSRHPTADEARQPVRAIPLKRGTWRPAGMSFGRYARWRLAWAGWYGVWGHRLARSPEMWVD